MSPLIFGGYGDTFHPAKRDGALSERGIDFLAAEAVFGGRTHRFEDRRTDDSETRYLTAGLLNGRIVIVGWTPHGTNFHVFTTRKANAREQALYGPLLR